MFRVIFSSIALIKKTKNKKTLFRNEDDRERNGVFFIMFGHELRRISFRGFFVYTNDDGDDEGETAPNVIIRFQENSRDVCAP